MKDNVLLTLFALFMSLCFATNTRAIDHAKNINENQKLIRLPEYKVEECLNKFLNSIVESNSQFYSNSKYFYSLEFTVYKGHHYLYITPVRFNKAKSLNYTAVINICKTLYLCKGDIQKDSLFHKTSNTKKIAISLAREAIDLAPSPEEPALETAIHICGDPLYVSVYTKAKIKGY